jgi:PAS domain S-box-containing protein
MSRWLRPIGPAAALFLGYSLLATLGLRWATVGGAASPVFPAAGVAVAGLWLGGARLWPAVLFGRLAACFATGSSLPLWVEVTIAAGNALAAALAAKAMRWVGAEPSLRGLRDVVALVIAAIGHAALAAAVGAFALATALDLGPAQATTTWLDMGTGTGAGALVVAPLLLSWAQGEPLRKDRAFWMHLGLSTAASAGCACVIFGPLSTELLWPFMLFPLLIWAALACGVRGAATAMLPIAVVTTLGTTAGYGPFASRAAAAAPASMHFVLAPQFIAIASITALMLAVVADERRAKEALQRSEARFRGTFENAAVGMAHVGLDGRWLLLNDRFCAISGYAREELLAIDFQTITHPDDLGQDLALLERLSRGEIDHYTMEKRYLRKGGEAVWVNLTVSALRNADGSVRKYIAVVEDIHARKQAEQELSVTRQQLQQILESERAARKEAERANRIKDEFLSTVSHELRTPLNAILGWAHILQKRMGGKEKELDKGLSVIDRNARAQAQLIEDLLDMSRIISGKLRVDLVPLDLRDVIAAAVTTVAPAAEAKGIQVETVASPGAGMVCGDASRLQQVVWNLVSNAIKFTPKGGRVKVSLVRTENHVEISVADTGQGIAPAFLPHVFDRFRQADSSTTRRYGGLGLGLAIVKNLVELHGGNLRAASDGEGKGATFTVELPLGTASAPSGGCRPAQAAAAREVEVDLNGVSVLFVDDAADNREVVRRLLEERNARVLLAGSGEEALAMLSIEGTDVLVSDIGMPGMDGYQLIRRVRALPREQGGDVKAVALTALAREEDRERALDAGFHAHLAKPIQPMELVALIGMLARRPSAVGP